MTDVDVSVDAPQPAPVESTADDSSPDAVSGAATDTMLHDRITRLEAELAETREALSSVVTADMLTSMAVPEHDHDERYYQKQEVDALIPEPAPDVVEVSPPPLPPELVPEPGEEVVIERGPRKVGWSW